MEYDSSIKEDKVRLLDCEYCGGRGEEFSTRTRDETERKCECSKIRVSEGGPDVNGATTVAATEQPRFHVMKIGCCEKIFSSFYKHLSLSKKELEAFEKIQLIMREEYDVENKSHEELLSGLYEMLFNKSPSLDLRSNEWKQFGFQTDNPRTDFRGGGYYSLNLMVHFVRYNSDDLQTILELNHFMFALIAIKLTFLMKIYFNIFQEEDHSLHKVTHKVTDCSRSEFKIFCSILEVSPLFMLDLMSKMLVFILYKFKERYNENDHEMGSFMLGDKLIYEAIDNLKTWMKVDCKSRSPHEMEEEIMLRIHKSTGKKENLH